MKSKLFLGFCILLSLLLSACAKEEGEATMQPDKMENSAEIKAESETKSYDVDWHDDASIERYYSSGELEYDSEKITANVKDIFDNGGTGIIVYDFWGWRTVAESFDRETGERTEIFVSSYPYIKGAFEDGVLYIMWGGENFVDGSVSQPSITEIDTKEASYPAAVSGGELYFVPIGEGITLGKGLPGATETHNLENNFISQVSAPDDENCDFMISFGKVDIAGYPWIPPTEVLTEEGVMTVTMYDTSLEDEAEITGGGILSAQQTDYGVVVRLELPDSAVRYVVTTEPLSENGESYGIEIKLSEDSSDNFKYPQGW